MSETAKLVATARETFGKGVARKLRAAGQTPVVVYGHGADPVHLSVETHPLTLIVRPARAQYATIETSMPTGTERSRYPIATASGPVQTSVERNSAVAMPPSTTEVRPAGLKPPRYQNLAPGRSSKRSSPTWAVRSPLTTIISAQS